MASTIKVLGIEAALGSASNVGGVKAVRLICTGGTALINQKDSLGANISTFTISTSQPEVVIKAPSDTLQTASANVLAVAVAFTN